MPQFLFRRISRTSAEGQEVEVETGEEVVG